MAKFKITLEGNNALLMHSARLSNPLDPMTQAIKKVSGKKTKTVDDHQEMSRLEHAGSMYFDEEFGPYLPSDNIWRSLLDGAKKHKLGVKVKEGVVFTTDVNPLIYAGPRDFEGLYEDKNFVHIASVKVGMARVMRTRPHFKNWKVEAEGFLDTNVLDFEDLEMIAETSGNLIGMGDWRPRFGRYTATVEKVK